MKNRGKKENYRDALVPIHLKMSLSNDGSFNEQFDIIRHRPIAKETMDRK